MVTNEGMAEVDVDHTILLLRRQYEHLPDVTKDTIRHLGKERACYFTSVSSEWTDVLGVIHDTCSRDDLFHSLTHLYFSGLLKEAYWLQLLFLAGNYPLVHRNLRFVWEMIFRAYYVDTYRQESPTDPEPPGPTIDDRVAWLDKYERKQRMYQWRFVLKVLRQLWHQPDRAIFEQHCKPLWNSLNEYVHPSRALLEKMVVETPGSLMTDVFDEKWALETIATARGVFDAVWLAVVSRFPECTEPLVQKGLLAEYPMAAAALRDLSTRHDL